MTTRINIGTLFTRLAAMLLAALCTANAGPRLVGSVSRVIDGDTLVVTLTSGPIRVRIYGIDAPEHNQTGGREATAALRELLTGDHVELVPVNQDRYSRLVARVFRDRLDVGARMVQQGNAWVYRHYLRREDRAWCAFERDAREAHRGLWARRYPIPPWSFRRHILSSAIPACP